jgi:hypothetical protein
MNHVLLAACAITETAKDDVVDGKSHGVFTHYLCETLRKGGRVIERRTLIDSVTKAVSGWNQTPRLEAKSVNGVLFTSDFRDDENTTNNTESNVDSPSGPTNPVEQPGAGSLEKPSSVGAVDPNAALGVLRTILNQGKGLTAENQHRALGVLDQILKSPMPTQRRVRDISSRHLVYVHGICKHNPGYSDEWWAALRPYTNAYGDGKLDDTRHEIVWSDLVNERGLHDLAQADTDGRKEWAARVRGVLEDRAATRAAMEPASGAAAPARSRDVFTRDLQVRNRLVRGASAVRGLSVPGLDCVDDFSVYMFDDGVRAQIIARFTDEVRQLLADNNEIDVISHSWGTVVAYEGLRALEDEGQTTQLVRNFFTVGAALSIFLVKTRLRPTNKDGRKPAIVKRWVNLNAHRDPVGGSIKGNPTPSTMNSWTYQTSAARSSMCPAPTGRTSRRTTRPSTATSSQLTSTRRDHPSGFMLLC